MDSSYFLGLKVHNGQKHEGLTACFVNHFVHLDAVLGSMRCAGALGWR